MNKEIRQMVYDEELNIEAYDFQGIIQPFPPHFHEYYVIGLITNGTRQLQCQNQEYILSKGEMLLLNPYDSHSCIQSDQGTLCYKSISISQETMQYYMRDTIEKDKCIQMTHHVINDEDMIHCFQRLHDMIMHKENEFIKEEYFLLLLSLLVHHYAQPHHEHELENSQNMRNICQYIEKHYDEHMTLNELCQISQLSQSTLLRSFTKVKGMTPYRYLMTIRINKAKQLLEQGISPSETALKVGFFDQSHFTKYFHSFVGLSPRVYQDIKRENYEK